MMRVVLRDMSMNNNTSNTSKQGPSRRDRDYHTAGCVRIKQGLAHQIFEKLCTDVLEGADDHESEICRTRDLQLCCSTAARNELVRNEVNHDHQHPREHQYTTFRKFGVPPPTLL
ncbi:hypothetical protein PRIPAC_97372 [Pristionchus pacificus]|uniref:Uncharacterized protein n=1 Tax=Pristionchus pacificus TaxID=54126 RepID=A0A8R1Z0A5_PRIPA|nr:hypothetical protein PRIPAC_97372 [Pristionchus pacificus]|eukprot:PDM84696.1 hypothetical protein PRIPAC_33719 [Pristionchus pacificus]